MMDLEQRFGRAAGAVRSRGLQFMRFGLVGALATAVYYVCLVFFVEVLMWPVLAASSLSFVIVTIENYVLHYVWTFRSDSAHTFAFPRFVFMNVVGFFMNYGIMFLGVRVLDWYYILVQALAIAAVISWNFSLSMLWIFGTRGTER